MLAIDPVSQFVAEPGSTAAGATDPHAALIEFDAATAVGRNPAFDALTHAIARPLRGNAWAADGVRFAPAGM